MSASDVLDEPEARQPAATDALVSREAVSSEVSTDTGISEHELDRPDVWPAVVAAIALAIESARASAQGAAAAKRGHTR